MAVPSEREILPGAFERVWHIEGYHGNALKWALWLLNILLLAVQHQFSFAFERGLPLDVYALIGYFVLNLIFTLFFGFSRVWERRCGSSLSVKLRRSFLIASYAFDYLYVAVLVGLTGGFQSQVYLIFGLLALKASIYYPYVKELAAIPFLSGILWVGASYWAAGGLYFLADWQFLFTYGLLFAWIIGCAIVGRLMERRLRFISALDANLSRKSEDLEDQSRVAQRMAGELANRLLELRSLQESVKAVNSALTLDELLQIIVENATMVLRGARCSVALVDDKRESVVTLAAAGIPRGELWGTSFRIGEGVAGWVVKNRRPTLIPSAESDPRVVRIGNRPIGSMVCVPLISDNQVIGALTATSPRPNAFTESDVNLLGAFSDQAAVAVKNARLYEQLVLEEKETARLYQSVLEKSNELEAILRGIGDGVIVIDPNLGVLMMNPIAVRIVRLQQTLKPGVRLPEIVTNELLLELARDILNDPTKPLIREITLEDDNDQAHTYQALASAVKGGGGEIRGAVIVMRDVTSQKEIDRMKSNFLSVVSHELRTPLHSIKGFVDIILMGKTGEINDLQRDFLTTVKESTTNLQRLIDDLLEFSRMEAGQIKLKPQMISVYEVADKVVEQMGPLAAEGKLKLVNAVPKDIALVEADPLRIEQVLTNLVSNAIKFTLPEGSVSILAMDLGEQLRISVQDTGIGIPEEEQAKIFQRFYQVDSSATRSYRGTGLGLTICKFIVEYHHGKIWVESEPGHGSTFHFLLPKRLPTDEAPVIDFTIPAAKRG